jgi:hypothetical protein
MRRFVFVPFAALLIGACGAGEMPTQPVDMFSEAAVWAVLDKACPVDAPAYSLPAELRITPPARGHMDWSALMAGIAREVPGGWGGLFYATTAESAAGRTQGPLTMYLVEPAKREEAIAALAPLLGSAGLERIVPELPTVQVRQGRWDYGQLYDWYHYLVQNVSRQGDIRYHSSGIAEARNRIEFGVVDEAARERLTTALNRLDIPCYLVAIEISPQPSTRR